MMIAVIAGVWSLDGRSSSSLSFESTMALGNDAAVACDSRPVRLGLVDFFWEATCMGTLSEAGLAIAVSEKWVRTVVVGLDFCPFARRELDGGTIRFHVTESTTVEDCCNALLDELHEMDGDAKIESTLVIFNKGFDGFDSYLMLVGAGEASLESAGYEGVYQLASFHPDYCFVDSSADDAANYTNRSPYPMIHILRGATVEEAIVQHPDAEAIPDRNIAVAREMGVDALEALREQCWFDEAGERLGG